MNIIEFDEGVTTYAQLEEICGEYFGDTLRGVVTADIYSFDEYSDMVQSAVDGMTWTEARGFLNDLPETEDPDCYYEDTGWSEFCVLTDGDSTFDAAKDEIREAMIEEGYFDSDEDEQDFEGEDELDAEYEEIYEEKSTDEFIGFFTDCSKYRLKI